MKTVHIISTKFVNIRINLMEYRDLLFFYMNLHISGGIWGRLMFGKIRVVHVADTNYTACGSRVHEYVQVMPLCHVA